MDITPRERLRIAKDPELREVVKKLQAIGKSSKTYEDPFGEETPEEAVERERTTKIRLEAKRRAREEREKAIEESKKAKEANPTRQKLLALRAKAEAKKKAEEEDKIRKALGGMFEESED